MGLALPRAGGHRGWLRAGQGRSPVWAQWAGRQGGRRRHAACCSQATCSACTERRGPWGRGWTAQQATPPGERRLREPGWWPGVCWAGPHPRRGSVLRGAGPGAPGARAGLLCGQVVVGAVTPQGGVRRLGRAGPWRRRTHPPEKRGRAAAPPPPPEPAREPRDVENRRAQRVRRGECLKAAQEASRWAQMGGRRAAVTPRAAAGGSGGSGPGRRGARPARGSCRAARSGHWSPCV